MTPTQHTSPEHQHSWICLVAQQGPSAPYGCQNCAATATGAEIGCQR